MPLLLDVSPAEGLAAFIFGQAAVTAAFIVIGISAGLLVVFVLIPAIAKRIIVKKT